MSSTALQEDNNGFWRKPSLAFGLGYLIFVIYGSFVPFQFDSIPLQMAWEQYVSIDFFNSKIKSRSDLAANVLLFIPLAFLWSQILLPEKKKGLRIACSFFLLFSLFLLSATIEFIQMLSPVRTTSVSDIYAETFGGAMGIALWHFWGVRFVAWLSTWKEQYNLVNVSTRCLWTYLFFLLGYNLLPLDLSLSPVDVYHKWKEGLVILYPFSFLDNFDANKGYEILSDILLWVPVAYFYTLTGRGAWIQAITKTLFIATVLECLQLFVASRVTDINDILFAALGGVIGAWAGVWTASKRGEDKPEKFKLDNHTLEWRWVVLFVLWAIIIALLFWYPYKVSLEREFLHAQVALLNRVPFTAYYFGTEFKAITAIFKRIIFFIPLGATGILALNPLKRLCVPPVFIALFLCGIVAFVVEAGRWLMPSKTPDTIDFPLEVLGGWIGIRLALYVLKQTDSKGRWTQA